MISSILARAPALATRVGLPVRHHPHPQQQHQQQQQQQRRLLDRSPICSRVGGNDTHTASRGRENETGTAIGSAAAVLAMALAVQVFHPAPAGAVVTYQDVLDFDEKTLQRVLSAGSFSTSGSTDELRQRVARVLQLQAGGTTEEEQAGPADEETSASEQIRRTAKPLEMSKDSPDPGKVVLVLFASSASLLITALLLESSATEEGGVLPAIARANKLAAQALEEIPTETARAVEADWDNGDDVVDVAAAATTVTPTNPSAIKDFLDEREAAMSSSELSDEEVRLREAVVSGIKAARSKKLETVQDKVEDGEGAIDTEREKSELAADGDGGEATGARKK